MIKFNVKLGGFSTVIGVALGIFLYNHSSLIIPEQVSKGNGNIINFDQQFDSASVSPSLKMLENMNKSRGEHERILIKITSPGGAVFEGKKLRIAMKTGVPVDTYIGAFGASMAADTWAQGVRRYVEPDALVMFHGAHGGTYDSSQTILAKKLNILTSPEFLKFMEDSKNENVPTNLGGYGPHSSRYSGSTTNELPKSTPRAIDTVGSKDLALYKDLKADVGIKGYDVVLMELRSSLDIISGINNTMVESMNNIIESSEGKFTVEILKKILFDDFSRDVVLTGKQLFDMGIATHLGAPNEEDYKSE